MTGVDENLVPIENLENTEQPQPVKPKSNKGFTFLLVMIFLTWSGIAAGGFYAFTAYNDYNNKLKNMLEQSQKLQAKDQQIQELNSKIVDLEKKIGNISAPSHPNQSDNLPPPPPTLPNQRVENVPDNSATQTSDALTSTGLKDLNAKTAELEQKYNELAKTLQTNKDTKNVNNLLISAINLRDAIKSSQNFYKELGDLKSQISPDDEVNHSIAVLDKYSLTGIESEPILKQQFYAILDNIVNNIRKEKQDKTLWDQAEIYLSDVITIRKIGYSTVSKDPEDIVSRAAHDVQNSDFKSAIAEISTLHGNPAVIAKDWLNKSKAYIDAKDASEILYRKAVQSAGNANNNRDNHG